MENKNTQVNGQEIKDTTVKAQDTTKGKGKATTPKATTKAKAGKGKAETTKVTTPKAETPKVETTPKVDPTLQQTIKDITQEKEKEIKFRYGIGGQTYSIFPILLDSAHNPFIQDILKDIPKKVSGPTLDTWAKENGTLTIIPVEAGNKIFYTLVLTAKKDTSFTTWDLAWDGENTLEYTTHNTAGDKVVKAGQQVVTNISTNRGKAINQGKALGKLLQMDFTNLEKTAKGNSYQLDHKTGELKELGAYSGNPTGNTLKTIGNLAFQDWNKMVTEFSRAR